MLLFRNIRSLRKKFLLGFISLNLLGLSYAVWAVSRKVQRSMEEQLRAHLVRTVQEQENSLKEELEMKLDWVNRKAGTSFIKEGAGGSGRRTVEFIRQLCPPGRGGGPTQVTLLSPSGREIAGNGAGGPAIDAKKSQWFSAIIESGKPGAALPDGGGKPYLVFAAPVFAGGKTAGALVAVFGFDFAGGILASEKAFQASLLSGDGRVVAGELPAQEGAWLASLPVKVGAPEIVTDKGMLYCIGVFSAPLETGMRYRLVLSAPLAEIGRPVAELRWYIFGIGAAISALLGLLIFRLTGELLRPLRGLKGAMELVVEKADSSVRVLVSGSDEIAALSAAFNHMLDSLDEKTRQLQTAGEQLSILAGITSASPFPIMLVDKELKIRVWNEAAEKLFGWTREEILGLSPFDTLVPEEEQEKVRALRARPDQREVVNFETVRRTKAGELIPVESQSSLCTGDKGAPLGNIVVYRDLREIRKLQESMLQSGKMSAVGQLAAGVAHEINNPLGIILGFAQGLVKRVGDGDPMALPFRSIEREALRCKNLVQSLLVFSRTSKSEQRELLPLEEILKSAVTLIEARTKASNIELAVEISPEPLNVMANTNQLQQIVVNLANNSVDAMPKGGKLVLRTLLSAKKPGWAELQVEDTGGGIPEAIREKIFEPFFTTKEAGKGTGLGLALAYEILRKHGGSIEVESEEGKGTRFTVLLPLHPETGPGSGETL